MKRANLFLVALALCACEVDTKNPHGDEGETDASVDMSPATEKDAGADASMPTVEADAGVDAGELPAEDATYVADPTSGGWTTFGAQTDKFKTGVDETVMLDGKVVAGVRSADETVSTADWAAWSTRMPMGSASKFHGKRVRMTAKVKTENVEDFAGLWMRIDGAETDPSTGYPKTLGFDNMSNRPIIGTTDWTEYAIVLDVADQISGIYFGLLVSSKGSAWVGPITFEVVDDSVPVTNMWPSTAE
jgi:hypothetical protein